MMAKVVISLALLFTAVAAQTCTSGTFRGVNGNCKSYELCLNGDWTPMECREGLMFDSAKGYCVEQDKSCESSCDGKPNGSFKADSSDCSAFEVCSSGEWFHNKCPEGYMFSPSLFFCVLNDGSCQNKLCKPGQFNSTSQCSRDFLICCDGEWRTDTCPLDLVFDSDKNFCVTPESCEDNTIKPIPCGDIPEGQFKPILKNCTAFEFCYQGKWIESNCPEGMKYGVNEGYCVNNANGECRDPRNDCDGQPEGSFKSDDKNCFGYKFCYQTEWVSGKCNQGMMWDSEKLFCVEDNGSCRPLCLPGQLEASDNSTCSAEFLVCCDNAWAKDKCTEGLVFDPNLKYCLKPESCSLSSPCGDVPEGTFRSNKTDCEAFEFCSKGEWVQLICPEGQMWSSTDLYCVQKDYTCKPCKGEVEGSLRPEGDCSMNYYMCLGETYIVQSCPFGMMFDPVLLYCTGISKQCGGKEQENCGDDQQGTLRPVDGKCNQYEQCYRGKWLSEVCSNGLMFDTKLLKCVDNDGSCEVCVC
ncbi:hypothetical protein ACFFRR_004109 [Megaselia abdita]